MKTEVYICVLCACLVTLEADKRSAKVKDNVNDFTFLSYKPTEKTKEQVPEADHINGSIYEQMTNHTFLNKTQGSILERNLTENEWTPD